MMFLKSIVVALLTLIPLAYAQDPMRDVAMGLQGLQEAVNNPAILAQLMEDMKDPELMKEAQKMMSDPQFQKEMKKMANSKEFKDSIKKTQEMMADPNTAAHAEAKMEYLHKVGKDQLKEGASSMMEQAMDAMNDPKMMQEMQKMIRDPNFKRELEKLSSNGEFQRYIEAMQEMMQDPAKRKQFEQITQQVMRS